MGERHIKDHERLEYVSRMLVELRRLANAERHPTLTYFIDMAYLEAMTLLEEQGASDRDREKRNAVA